jgi:regulatory protein
VSFTEHKVNKIKLSPEQAFFKIKHWCAYQERSQSETRYKLREYGLYAEDVELIISNLIDENFLNEERFAVTFAGGKSRIKQWGRNKIKIELKKHKVSEYCINKALKSLDNVAYEKILENVLRKKLQTVKAESSQKVFYAALNYAVSRGFESDLVTQQLNVILEK